MTCQGLLGTTWRHERLDGEDFNVTVKGRDSIVVDECDRMPHPCLR